MDALALFAARYAHNRNTGAPLMVVRQLMQIWPELQVQTREKIIKESKNEAMYCLEDWRLLWDLADNELVKR